MEIQRRQGRGENKQDSQTLPSHNFFPPFLWMIWKSNTSFFLVSAPEWPHVGTQSMTREPPFSSPQWPRTCHKWSGAAFSLSGSQDSSHLVGPGLCQRLRFSVPDLGFPMPHRSCHNFFFYLLQVIPCFFMQPLEWFIMLPPVSSS